MTKHAERLECIIRTQEASTVDIPEADTFSSTLGASHEGHEPSGNVQDADPNDLPRFNGGTLVFFHDRVELCDVDICSGRRCRTRRAILDLLREKSNDGTYKAYSGENLATRIGATSAGTIAGAIRDLRDAIVNRLRNQKGIDCTQKDVILSGGPGYRFAECISVQLGPGVAVDGIKDIEYMDNVPDVPNGPVGDFPYVPDDDVADASPEERQERILSQLQKGVRLKGPDVVRKFSCSPKTAQRDLTALIEAGEIEFAGSSRTGYYLLCKSEDEA